jgi:hypothetical protein
LRLASGPKDREPQAVRRRLRPGAPDAQARERSRMRGCSPLPLFTARCLSAFQVRTRVTGGLKRTVGYAEGREMVERLARVAVSDEWSRKQRVTTTCAFCGESIEAFVPEAVAWFAEHRRAKHPSVPEPERRPPRRPSP